jgi:eukaryotic-like serine/threonine-protein kinase
MKRTALLIIVLLILTVSCQPAPTPTPAPPTAVAGAPRTTMPPTTALVPTLVPPTTARVPTMVPTTVAPTPGIGEMVLIPAGEFTMGSNDGDSDEKPSHTVYLDTFWMDKFEVTNALYKKCMDTGKCSRPSETKSSTRSSYYGNSQYDNYPVIYVSWNDANAFCAWAGKRLPTEAEWEKAARGTDARTYPWGNNFDRNLLNSSEGDKSDTTAVGSYPGGASPYGIMDMAGNVWEWVADWYSDNYYSSSPRNNPTGPSSGQYPVVRGGSWLHISIYARASGRFTYKPDSRYINLGFRCAQ